MCMKKVACGLQKVVREDGRTVLEPVFVEIECPEDMHSITGKVESCKTVTPKIVEENVQEVEVLPVTVQNEHDGTHGGHGGVTVIDSPTGKVTTDSKEATTVNKEVTTVNKEVVCIDTGEVFSSIRQASRATGIDFSNISKCCNGKLKSAGGKHWKYL